jgi:hypothetical protein
MKVDRPDDPRDCLAAVPVLRGRIGGDAISAFRALNIDLSRTMFRGLEVAGATGRHALVAEHAILGSITRGTFVQCRTQKGVLLYGVTPAPTSSPVLRSDTPSRTALRHDADAASRSNQRGAAQTCVECNRTRASTRDEALHG